MFVHVVFLSIPFGIEYLGNEHDVWVSKFTFWARHVCVERFGSYRPYGIEFFFIAGVFDVFIMSLLFLLLYIHLFSIFSLHASDYVVTFMHAVCSFFLVSLANRCSGTTNFIMRKDFEAITKLTKLLNKTEWSVSLLRECSSLLLLSCK